VRRVEIISEGVGEGVGFILGDGSRTGETFDASCAWFRLQRIPICTRHPHL